jgi:hypothetical protein
MRTLNHSIAAVLLCGAVGFAYPAIAQTGAAAPDAAASNTNNSGQTVKVADGSAAAKSTPAKGSSRAAMARRDRDERRITTELNRASSASDGNANVLNQALATIP